ncbi:hypothetical protein QL285_067419 [Trifolium repens]|nr:hypothetical protein QL285_067419 [Trifolium repens]
MQTITNLNNASEASARSLWIRTHSRHLECELLLDDRLMHLPDRSQTPCTKSLPDKGGQAVSPLNVANGGARVWMKKFPLEGEHDELMTHT